MSWRPTVRSTSLPIATMISSGRRRRQDAREACKEVQDLFASISARFLRLAQPGSRCQWVSHLANLRLFVEDPSLQGRSAWECVHSWGVRARRNSLTEHMWRATGGLRGFRSCVGEQVWRLLPFDAGERREGEFGRAVEQRETWSRDHTPEVSRGPHGRNRLGRTFRLPWLRAERAHPGVRRAPWTWTGEDFPLTPGSPSARHQSEHESAWYDPWPHLRLAQKGSRRGSSHPGRTADSRLQR